MKKAQAELDRLTDLGNDSNAMLKKDDRPMQEILKAKREQTQALIEETKSQPAGQETVEARKARLQAQRDLLREHKKKQMAKELEDFNKKTSNKDNLYSELKKMDEEKKKPAADSEEMAKRRQILKGVKAAIDGDDGKLSMSAKGGSSILDDLEAFKVE